MIDDLSKLPYDDTQVKAYFAIDPQRWKSLHFSRNTFFEYPTGNPSIVDLVAHANKKEEYWTGVIRHGTRGSAS